MADVKLGFVGCGFMGQVVHLPSFLSVPGCEVVVLAEKRPKLARPRLGRAHDHLLRERLAPDRDAPPLLRNVGAWVTLYRGADMRETWQPIPQWTWGFYNEAAHFVECVAQGKVPDSSGQDSLRDIEIAEEVFTHGLGVG